MCFTKVYLCFSLSMIGLSQRGLAVIYYVCDLNVHGQVPRLVTTTGASKKTL